MTAAIIAAPKAMILLPGCTQVAPSVLAAGVAVPVDVPVLEEPEATPGGARQSACLLASTSAERLTRCT